MRGDHQNMCKRSALWILASALLASGCTNPSVSPTMPFGPETLFVYPVKVVCQSETLGFTGIQPANVQAPALDDSSREENITTSVNVTNFSLQNVSITFRATGGGSPSQDQTETLAASRLRNFTCNEFITLLRGTAPGQAIPPTEGMLILESRVELQVVAVYQRRSLAAGIRDRLSGFGFNTAAKNVYTGEEVPPVEIVPLRPLGAVGERPSLGKQPEAGSTPGGQEKPQKQTGEVTVGGVGDDGGVIEIPIIPRPTAVSGAGLGIGVGYGVGRGIGVGIGVGSSIDVEYVDPRMVRRKL